MIEIQRKVLSAISTVNTIDENIISTTDKESIKGDLNLFLTFCVECELENRSDSYTIDKINHIEEYLKTLYSEINKEK